MTSELVACGCSQAFATRFVSSLVMLLVFADRQRTLRELEVGRTLFHEGGRWLIKHQARMSQRTIIAQPVYHHLVSLSTC